jgi:hypothetical protein
MTARNGLPCDDIFSIVSDENNYWLYTRCGLVGISSTQIQHWWGHPSLVLKVNVIDQSDGVQRGEAPFSPQASRSPDSKLWFANNSVLQMSILLTQRRIWFRHRCMWSKSLMIERHTIPVQIGPDICDYRHLFETKKLTTLH